MSDIEKKILTSLSRIEQELKRMTVEAMKKGDMKEALRLQSRKEGVKLSIVTIKQLVGKIEIIK